MFQIVLGVCHSYFLAGISNSVVEVEFNRTWFDVLARNSEMPKVDIWESLKELENVSERVLHFFDVLVAENVAQSAVQVLIL